jgi:hypothetical protein
MNRQAKSAESVENDPMYGPAVRSKKISTIAGWWSCINVSDL